MTGWSRSAGVLAIVAVVALQLGACGGEDDSGSALATSGARQAPLTKAQYVKRASALCSRYRRQISDRLDAFAETPNREEGSSELAGPAMDEVVLPGFRLQYEGLRALPPPRGDEAFLDLMLSKFSRSLEVGEENIARFFRVKRSLYSEFAEGTLMTEEYGIKGCGSRGRSPRAVIDAFSA